MKARFNIKEQIQALDQLRRLLQHDRRSLSGVIIKLKKENQQLRDDKRALLNYIKELEKFTSKIDIAQLKEHL